jgi:hypothetical protein
MKKIITIAELKEILNNPNRLDIVIQPDGSITAVPFYCLAIWEEVAV